MPKAKKSKKPLKRLVKKAAKKISHRKGEPIRVNTKKISAKKSVSLIQNQPEEIQLKRTKIRVFGIGGGGSSIISEIASKVKKASFFAVNTDKKALGEASRGVTRFQFGESFTHGLGTGMNAETGEQAALAEKDRIKKLFEGQDLCIFVSCLGGGTGSGATKVLAKLAKSAGCLTFGILTLPFNFEGEKKAFIARQALDDLKNKLHAYAVIPNERIFQIIEKQTPLRTALSAINTKLANSLEGLIEVIYDPGLINIDFADLKAILEGQGKLTYLNTVEVKKKEGAVQDEINMLLNSPLYPYGIKGARGVLYNIAGEKELSLAEVSQISRNISELVNKEARIIFGISQNQSSGRSIKTTLLASGCGTKIFSEQSLELKPALQPKKDPERKEKTDNLDNQNKIKPKASRLHGKKRKSKTPTKEAEGKGGAGKKNKPKGAKNKKAEPKKKEAVKKIPKKKNNQKRKISAKRKVKIKVIAQDELQNREVTASLFPIEEKTQGPLESKQVKIRKNALQIRADVEREEADMLAKEKVWETPAFLRRKKSA